MDYSSAEKFAFFVHPRYSAIEDMGKVFRPIAWIAKMLSSKRRERFERWLQEKSILLPPLPFPCREVSSRKVIGWIIVIPFMGRHLIGRDKSIRDAAMKCMIKGVRLASRLGAKILGLGALTAPSTHGGKDLVEEAEKNGIFITNGNSLTGGITSRAAIQAATQFGYNIEEERIAILGACGSVGRSVSELLALQGYKLLCIDTNDAKLKEFSTEMKNYGFENVECSGDPSRIKESRISIIVTSAAQAIVTPDLLAPDALVYDDTQPRNTSEDVIEMRPDVRIVDGGILEASDINFGIDIGLAPHLAYACLGETILMAKDGCLEHHVGDCTWISATNELSSLDRNYSTLKIAKFRSFNKEI